MILPLVLRFKDFIANLMPALRCVGMARTGAGFNVMMVTFWAGMDAVQSVR